ncbi:tRNA dimethylallyltransferase [Deinobacterium chartae]|uniref:tRNA dimethylallyltransferase n=1 Tax=Deinobacterium chartae TaxID=521158 RepID=A0A841HV76_9DEIO|nr:tRNA dimethylallyltransferase [Deinobacterium chartae]
MTRAVILTGPTASGKTDLSLRLGREFPLEVISADAMMVYRGLDIGTAKPTPQERAGVPHHLIDIREVTEDYDVVQFARDAVAAVEEVRARGRLPLIVGGTAFYLSALLRGLPTTPPSDPAAMRALEDELAERGLEAMLAEVAALRPAELVRIERNPRRLLRSLEVYRATGRFPSEFPQAQPVLSAEVVAISPPEAELERRIALRTDRMIADGLVEEALRVLGPLRQAARRPTALQAIGYREALVFAQGLTDRARMRADIVLATRRYAKRQRTFLRTQLGAALHDPLQAERIMKQKIHDLEIS